MRITYSLLERKEKEHFDKIAKIYDQNYGYNEAFTKHKIHKKAGYLLRLLKKYNLSKKTNILEVGCGTGAYTAEVAKKLNGLQVTAIDISSGIIKVAKDKTKGLKNIKYAIKSIYNTGLRSRSVDVVFGFYVLHHLEINKAIREIDRILKPGGLVFFCEPNILNPLVYLIKSNKHLKQKVGDSPEEWAINPLKVREYFSKFEVLDILTSEFIIPVKFLPYKWILRIDNFTRHFTDIPIIKYLGGSVQIFARKRGI